MTEPSAADPAGGAAVRRSLPIGVVLAWVTIVGVVLFVGIRTWQGAHTKLAEQAADDVSMQIASRTAVGYGTLLKTVGQSAPDKLRSVSNQVTADAHTPKQRLRAVTVIGELQGAQAALDELRRGRADFDSAGLDADADSLHTIYTAGVGELSDDEREELVHDLGWHGRLALSFNVPADDAGRKKIASSGLRAMGAAIAIEILIVLVVIGGIAFMTTAIVRGVDGKVRLAYRPAAPPAGPFVEAFALYIAGYVGIGYLLHRLNVTSQLLAYSVELAWIVFACCWPLMRGVSGKSLRQGLGWHAGRGVGREVLAGLGGYMAGIPVLALGIYVSTMLAKVTGEKAVHPIVFGTGGGVWAMIGLYLLASVWAPVVEETMFRGALFHHLRSGHRWLFSAVVSGVIFASVHPQGWTAIPLLAAIGVVFAGIREWRGTAVASAAAHALHNGVATTFLFLVLG